MITFSTETTKNTIPGGIILSATITEALTSNSTSSLIATPTSPTSSNDAFPTSSNDTFNTSGPEPPTSKEDGQDTSTVATHLASPTAFPTVTKFFPTTNTAFP